MKTILFNIVFIAISGADSFAQEKISKRQNNYHNANKHAITNSNLVSDAQDSINLVNFDSIIAKFVYLNEITLVGYKSKTDVQQMPEVVGTNIYAGKKSQLIVVDNVQGNIITNTMRQVVAKVPGLQIWESDGSGIQIGIGARGLSPNRSWEFNVRQNDK